MKSNIPKSSTQMIRLAKVIPNPYVNNEFLSNQNISPISRVSILKTEEQKEVVRTNVYEPNNNDLLNNQQFCVVTEVIRRSSNISLEPQNNSFNNGHLNYSFKQNSFDNPTNQSFQKKTITIHLADSSSE